MGGYGSGPPGVGPGALTDCWSHSCSWEQLALPCPGLDEAREALNLSAGWLERWTIKWKTAEESSPVRLIDLVSMPRAGTMPVRSFTWRRAQRNRPQLSYLVSTDRHHGAESTAEARLLLVLDFVAVREVLAQPVKLRYETVEKTREHIPDFLTYTDTETWLIDVRPAHLVKDDDQVAFAAAAQAALAAGWRYIAVTDWHPHVTPVLDNLSGERRPLTDRMRLTEQILTAVQEGPRLFAEIVEATSVPAMARAYVRHLLWHRRLSIELGKPLGDGTLVYDAKGALW